MLERHSLLNKSRRDFLNSIILSGPAICIGCSNLLARDNNTFQLEESDKHKFQNDFCRSHEEAWKWRFGYFIDRMEAMSDIIGREILINLLKQASTVSQLKKSTDNSKNTLLHFINNFKINPLYENSLTYEILEESDRTFNVNILECLWAKTFLARDCGDIGYATMCYAELSSIKAYNKNINLKLEKTLMQGNNLCTKRYTMQI